MSDDETAPEEQREPTQEEFAMALAERLARTPVRDVLFQCMATFLDMATIRLGLGPAGPEVSDLPQARQAIESVRALMAVAEREMGPAQVRPFREPLAQLQTAYARAAEESTEEEATSADVAEGSPGAPPAARPGPPPVDPAARLWVPPGSRQ